MHWDIRHVFGIKWKKGKMPLNMKHIVRWKLGRQWRYLTDKNGVSFSSFFSGTHGIVLYRYKVLPILNTQGALYLFYMGLNHTFYYHMKFIFLFFIFLNKIINTDSYNEQCYWKKIYNKTYSWLDWGMDRQVCVSFQMMWGLVYCGCLRVLWICRVGDTLAHRCDTNISPLGDAF